MPVSEIAARSIEHTRYVVVLVGFLLAVLSGLLRSRRDRQLAAAETLKRFHYSISQAMAGRGRLLTISEIYDKDLTDAEK